MSSDNNSSNIEDDNENSETDNAGVQSWTTDEVIAFLTRLRPRKAYTSGFGFRVMSKSMGKEIEEWFGSKPKPQNLKIEDLTALKIVTTHWELVKDAEQFQYKLKRRSTKKESTQAEAKAKRKQGETKAATSPLETPTKRLKKGENKTV